MTNVKQQKELQNTTQEPIQVGGGQLRLGEKHWTDKRVGKHNRGKGMFISCLWTKQGGKCGKKSNWRKLRWKKVEWQHRKDKRLKEAAWCQNLGEGHHNVSLRLPHLFNYSTFSAGAGDQHDTTVWAAWVQSSSLGCDPSRTCILASSLCSWPGSSKPRCMHSYSDGPCWLTEWGDS